MAIPVENIKNVSVIGAGLMGHGIAQLLAASNHEVCLVDVSNEILAKAMADIKSNLVTMANYGIGAENEIEPTIGRIRTTTSLAEAADGAQFVIEAVVENVELKQQIFRDLDQMCSRDAILATNTSVISITQIASHSRYQNRIVGTHFWNPPHLMDLVEVIKGHETADEVVDTAFNFLKKAGKYPVKVLKDAPGFIGNRLQHALWREAISIVQEGIADAAGVDDVAKRGFGRRLPVLGPMENADMIGLDLTLAIHEYLMPHIESSPQPQPLLKDKVARGELGMKTGQGFATWSAQEADTSRRNLASYLLKLAREERSRER